MVTSSLKPLLLTALKENNLALDETAIQKLCCYLDLLNTWNKIFNLTSITNRQEMVYLHTIDSLIISPYLLPKHCLDVGSGAGLPGIPLAIVNPETEWVLLDKNNKKTRFLTQVVAELGLSNVKVAHTRCEDFHPFQGFDSILSRAFGSLALFLETTEHLLAPKGILLAMKGKFPEAELAEIPKRFTYEVIRLDIKGRNLERHLVRLRKKNEEG